MSVITTVIQPQAFERVRDQIGAILKVEITNQFFRGGDYLFADAEVWRERLIHFDHTELPAVNVMFAGGPFSNQDAKQTEGTYNYYVDCYTKAKASADAMPDILAMVKLHRLMGVCRAILMDARYITLGFQAPFISNRNIQQMVIGDPSKMDATTSVFGRLVVSVRMREIVDLKTVPIIQDFLSNIRLVLTDKGYIWEGTSS